MGWAQGQVAGVHWAVQGFDLDSWTCSTIHKSLTGRPAIVTVTACLLLIRDAFRTLWEYLPVYADAHGGGRPRGLYSKIRLTLKGQCATQKVTRPAHCCVNYSLSRGT